MEGTSPTPSDPHAVAIAQLTAKYEQWLQEREAFLSVDPTLDQTVKLAFDIIHMGKAFEYHLTRAADGSRMTALQARFAWIMATSAGGVPMPSIAVALGISPAAVSKMVARMEARELVTITANPTDLRSVVVALTPAGRDEWQEIRARLAGVDQEVKDAVGRRSAHQFANEVASVTALDPRHEWFEDLRNLGWAVS